MISTKRPLPRGRRGGFTLIELLVTMVVLLVLVLVMVTMTNQTSRLWRSSRARIDAFQSARNAFQRITDHLGQTTLNTYLDYYNTAGQSRCDVLRGSLYAKFVPATYDRASDLQFVCGQAATLVPPTTGSRPTHAVFFQAPLGYVAGTVAGGTDLTLLNSVLNGVGYYIDFANTSAQRPAFMTSVAPAWRYRLMELYQPSQNLGIYYPSSVVPNPEYSGSKSWFNLAVDPPGGGTAPTIVTSDNIVALIVRPESASTADVAATGATATEIAPAYSYDTKAYVTKTDTYSTQAKNQLPPMVQVTMVAIDADSAVRLAAQFGSNPPTLYSNSPFTDVTQYKTDLAALESGLQSSHLTYHVFVENVSLLGAQWTQSKTQ